MDIERTCAFTGHRDIENKDDIKDLKKMIINAVNDGFTVFLCGMARGFDLLAAEEVINLKAENEQIKLIACIPCPGQDKYFSAEDKEKYARAMEKCDGVVCVSSRYFNGCMHVRDRFLIDNSNAVICYVRKKTGGAYYTLSYAISKNKKLYVL